jgi:hypothetical protein
LFATVIENCSDEDELVALLAESNADIVVPNALGDEYEVGIKETNKIPKKMENNLFLAVFFI